MTNAYVDVTTLISVVEGFPYQWSKNFVSLEYGFDSYQQGKGLIKKQGSLVLQNTTEDSQPLLTAYQNSLRVGAEIYVSLVTTDGDIYHPLAQKMWVIGSPEINPLNPNLPTEEGNILLKIPVGCRFSYYDIEEPDADRTGVTTGYKELKIEDVIKNVCGIIIEKNEREYASINPSPSYTGIPDGQINQSAVFDKLLPSEGYVNFPFVKNGQSFVDLAADFAYSKHTPVPSEKSYPTVMYEKEGVIHEKQIKLINPLFVIEAGLDDVKLDQQIDINQEVGEFEIIGVERKTKDLLEDYPYTERSTFFTGQTSIPTTSGGSIGGTGESLQFDSEVKTTYYLSDAGQLTDFPYFLKSNKFGTIATVKPFTGVIPIPPKSKDPMEDFDPGFIPDPNGVYRYRLTEISTSVPPQKVSSSASLSTSGTDLVQSGITLSGSFYDAVDRLAYELEWKMVAAEALFPDGWEDSTVATDAKKIRLDLRPSEITIIQYTYDLTSVITSKITSVYSNLFLIDRLATFDEEFEFAFQRISGTPTGTEKPFPDFNMITREVKTETWAQLSGKFIYKVSTAVPRIINNPLFVPLDKFSDGTPLTVEQKRQQKMELQSKNRVDSTNNVTPPPTNYFGSRYSIVENTRTATVTLSDSKKRQTLQIPFFFVNSQTLNNNPEASSSQPQNFAKIEARIANGRAHQYLVQVPPSKMFTIKDPMQLVSVQIINKQLTLCMDALTWYHDRYSTYVGFLGILVGESNVANSRLTNAKLSISFAQIPEGLTGTLVTSSASLSGGVKIAPKIGAIIEYTDGSWYQVLAVAGDDLTVKRVNNIGTPNGNTVAAGGNFEIVGQNSTQSSFTQPIVSGTVTLNIYAGVTFPVGTTITFNDGANTGTYTVTQALSSTHILVERLLGGTTDGTVMSSGGAINAIVLGAADIDSIPDALEPLEPLAAKVSVIISIDEYRVWGIIQ